MIKIFLENEEKSLSCEDLLIINILRRTIWQYDMEYGYMYGCLFKINALQLKQLFEDNMPSKQEKNTWHTPRDHQMSDRA